MENQTLSSAEAPVSRSVSQETEQDLMEQVGLCGNMCELYVKSSLIGLFGRTSQERSQARGGADFKCLLESLDKLRYGLAWRVLDAQFFGVAQRRRRVFLVGHLGDVRGATEVLFEPHMLYGNLGASKTKRAELTATAQRSPRKCVQIVGNVINRTERSGGNGNGLCDADSEGGYTLTATDRHAVIEEPLCFDTTQITSAQNGNNPKRGDACHTLSANADPPTIIMREREGCTGGGKGALIQDNVSATLATTNDQVLCVMGTNSNAAITNDHASTLLSYQGGEPYVVIPRGERK